MPLSFSDWALYFCVSMLIPAVAAYFCGNVNGAILMSKLFLHDDVRTHGSGNAGLTNFYRNYGSKYLIPMIAVDVLKMIAAVVLSCLFMGSTPEAKLWGGLFCVLGHMFPVLYKFKGGKGILSSGVLLWMLDWRVALAAWGVFALLVILTRYVSLGSVICCATVPVTMLLFYFGRWFAFAEATLLAVLVIWAHRANIKRLLTRTESKLTIKKNET